jgi:uncharacterized protein DUF4166
MKQAAEPTTGLYERLLGATWDNLPELVRRLHQACGIRAEGSFRVRRGNRFASGLAWLAQLPAACDAVELLLTVSPSSGREQWQRLFARRAFTTMQWADNGCLIERVGLSEVRLRLQVIDGALHYRTERVVLRLGPLRVPLPRWLAPRITACETPDGSHLRVHVDVVLPLVGLLIAYDGVLTKIETMPC